MKELDTALVRKHFPAFDDNETSQWAFFENAGGTFPARGVVERLNTFYSKHKVQPYGPAPWQKQAGEAMDAGRLAMAEILGLPVETLSLGPSTTQNFNTLATAFGTDMNSGDEIIVSEQDHEANIGAWVRNAERSGASLRFWTVDEATGQLSLDDLKKLLSPKTVLVAVTHSSNVIGSINPLKEIATLAHGVGAALVADGVSYAPHGLPDIKSLGVDAYCFSTYKTFGTHMGIMYINPELSDALKPQCHYFNESKGSSRFDAAGPDHASIAALAGIGEYFEQLHLQHDGDKSLSLATKVQQCSEAFKTHEQRLLQPVLELLDSRSCRIYGSPICDSSREANVAFTTETISSGELTTKLAGHQIAAGNGHFYAPRVLERMGVKDLDDGVLRLSFAHYNTDTEVERLLTALDDILPQ